MTGALPSEAFPAWTPPDHQGALVPAADPSASLLAVIARAAADPTVDVSKMSALLDLQERLMASRARGAYAEAMNHAQAEIQPVARTAENKQNGNFYAKLEDVDEAIRPIYLRHGFSVSYNTVAPLTPGNIRVEGIVSHSGHIERFYREAAADTLGPKGSAVKTALHGGASTETFLKRYLLCGAFNVVFKGMDDDGVRAGKRYISGDQLKELDALRRELGVSVEAFCESMAVSSLPEIEEPVFPVAMNMLLSRKRRLAAAEDGKP